MSLTVYTAAEAADVAKCQRPRVDAACTTGALPAADLTPQSAKRKWRILEADLREWVRRGYPVEA